MMNENITTPTTGARCARDLQNQQLKDGNSLPMPPDEPEGGPVRVCTMVSRREAPRLLLVQSISDPVHVEGTQTSCERLPDASRLIILRVLLRQA